MTPAPVHRPSFWGSERDEAGDLPPAEGVPEQSEWDPVARLLDLQKRQADVLEHGAENETREIPKREHVGSAATLKPGQAAELAQLAQDKVAEERAAKAMAGPPGTDAEVVAGKQGELAGDKPIETEQQESTTQQAVNRTGGGDAAVGSRAQVMAEMLKAEPTEEALQGPAPLTTAVGAPGQTA